MAVIGKIRKHSGLILITVGIALAAFVLGDFFKSGPKRDNNVGEINGEEITIMEFNSRVDVNLENERRNKQVETLTPEERFTIQERTWEQVLYDRLMGEEFDNLGLTVTPEELYELVQGRNPHEFIVQIFTNPQTGQFDRNRVLNYLEALRQNQVDQSTIDWWVEVEKAIKQDQQRKKYNALVAGGFMIPQAFSEIKYQEEATDAFIRIMGQKYHRIPDSLVSFTENEVEDYYEKEKLKFEEDETIDVDYVVFEVLPSEEDYNHADEDIAAIYQEFLETENIPTFVNATSDRRYDSVWWAEGLLPVQIDSTMFHSKVGVIVPPYFEDNTYHMARLMDISYRPDSMKATHLLVAYTGATRASQEITRTRDEAQKLADSLYGVIKDKPGSYDNLIATYSDDPSAVQNKGDLGWFDDQTMIYPFNEAVLQGGMGAFDLVESPFGFHILKVTGKSRPVKKVRVALIERKVEPSSKTYQDIYTRASIFAGENNTQDKFEDAVLEQNLVKRTAAKVGKMSNDIAGLDYPRNIIRWAYSENVKPGDISPIFDMGAKYVVAMLKVKREKGYMPLEELRSSIENQIRRDKKAEYLIEKMNGFTGNIYQMAADLGVDVDTVSVSFGSANVSGVGSEPKVVATAFTMDEGVLSDPIEGRTGVFRIIVDQKLLPGGTTDYATYNMKYTSPFKRNVEQGSPYEAIKKEADIIDNRILYY